MMKRNSNQADRGDPQQKPPQRKRVTKAKSPAKMVTTKSDGKKALTRKTSNTRYNEDSSDNLEDRALVSPILADQQPEETNAPEQQQRASQLDFLEEVTKSIHIDGNTFSGASQDHSLESPCKEVLSAQSSKILNTGETPDKKETDELVVSRQTYVWGNNSNGQISREINRQFFQDPVPIKLAEVQRFAQVACGKAHTMMITLQGAVFTMGSNEYGQLGSGDSTDGRCGEPTLVEGLAKTRLIACGAYSSFAVSGDSLYAWGAARISEEVLRSPVEVCIKGINSKIKSVSAGLNHAAVLTDNHELFLWGANSKGQLGLDHTEVTFVPTASPDFQKLMATKVSCGQEFTFIITESNEMLVTGKIPFGVEQPADEPDYVQTFQSVAQFESGVDVLQIETSRFASILVKPGNDSDPKELFLWGETPLGLFQEPTSLNQLVSDCQEAQSEEQDSSQQIFDVKAVHNGQNFSIFVDELTGMTYQLGAEDLGDPFSSSSQVALSELRDAQFQSSSSFACGADFIIGESATQGPSSNPSPTKLLSIRQSPSPRKSNLQSIQEEHLSQTSSQHQSSIQQQKIDLVQCVTNSIEPSDANVNLLSPSPVRDDNVQDPKKQLSEQSFRKDALYEGELTPSTPGSQLGAAGKTQEATRIRNEKIAAVMQQAIHTEESVKDHNEASVIDLETDLANVKKQLDFADAKTPKSVVGDQQIDHKQLLKTLRHVDSCTPLKEEHNSYQTTRSVKALALASSNPSEIKKDNDQATVNEGEDCLVTARDRPINEDESNFKVTPRTNNFMAKASLQDSNTSSQQFKTANDFKQAGTTYTGEKPISYINEADDCVAQHAREASDGAQIQDYSPGVSPAYNETEEKVSMSSRTHYKPCNEEQRPSVATILNQSNTFQFDEHDATKHERNPSLHAHFVMSHDQQKSPHAFACKQVVNSTGSSYVSSHGPITGHSIPQQRVSTGASHHQFNSQPSQYQQYPSNGNYQALQDHSPQVQMMLLPQQKSPLSHRYLPLQSQHASKNSAQRLPTCSKISESATAQKPPIGNGLGVLRQSGMIQPTNLASVFHSIEGTPVQSIRASQKLNLSQINVAGSYCDPFAQVAAQQNLDNSLYIEGMMIKEKLDVSEANLRDEKHKRHVLDSQHKSEVEILRSQVQDLMKQIEKSGKDYAKLLSQIDEDQEETAALRERVRSQETQLSAQQIKIADADHAIRGAQDSKQRLEQELKETVQALKEAEAAVRTQNLNESMMQEQQNRCSSETCGPRIEELECQLKKKAALVYDLTRQLGGIELENKELQTELKDRTEDLQSRLNDFKEIARCDLENANEKNEKLQSELLVVQDENESLRERIQQLMARPSSPPLLHHIVQDDESSFQFQIQPVQKCSNKKSQRLELSPQSMAAGDESDMRMNDLKNKVNDQLQNVLRKSAAQREEFMETAPNGQMSERGSQQKQVRIEEPKVIRRSINHAPQQSFALADEKPPISKCVGTAKQVKVNLESSASGTPNTGQSFASSFKDRANQNSGSQQPLHVNRASRDRKSVDSELREFQEIERKTEMEQSQKELMNCLPEDMRRLDMPDNHALNHDERDHDHFTAFTSIDGAHTEAMHDNTFTSKKGIMLNEFSQQKPPAGDHEDFNKTKRFIALAEQVCQSDIKRDQSPMQPIKQAEDDATSLQLSSTRQRRMRQQRISEAALGKSASQTSFTRDRNSSNSKPLLSNRFGAKSARVFQVYGGDEISQQEVQQEQRSIKMLTTPSRPEQCPSVRNTNMDKTVSAAKGDKSDKDGVSQRSTSRLRQPTPVAKSPALKATIEKIEKKQSVQTNNSRAKLSAANTRNHSARVSNEATTTTCKAHSITQTPVSTLQGKTRSISNLYNQPQRSSAIKKCHGHGAQTTRQSMEGVPSSTNHRTRTPNQSSIISGRPSAGGPCSSNQTGRHSAATPRVVGKSTSQISGAVVNANGSVTPRTGIYGPPMNLASRFEAKSSRVTPNPAQEGEVSKSPLTHAHKRVSYDPKKHNLMQKYQSQTGATMQNSKSFINDRNNVSMSNISQPNIAPARSGIMRQQNQVVCSPSENSMSEQQINLRLSGNISNRGAEQTDSHVIQIKMLDNEVSHQSLLTSSIQSQSVHTLNKPLRKSQILQSIENNTPSQQDMTPQNPQNLHCMKDKLKSIQSNKLMLEKKIHEYERKLQAIQKKSKRRSVRESMEEATSLANSSIYTSNASTSKYVSGETNLESQYASQKSLGQRKHSSSNLQNIQPYRQCMNAAPKDKYAMLSSGQATGLPKSQRGLSGPGSNVNVLVAQSSNLVNQPGQV